MKVNGIQLQGLRTIEVYLPVNGGEVVCFKFRPLRSDENFEDVMPRPKAPTRILPGNKVMHATDDPTYKKMLGEWIVKKFNWEFLKSIDVTEDLHFETVDLNDPSTWDNWRKEMMEYFGEGLTVKVFQGYLDAQYIDEEQMEKARARFLTGRQTRLEAVQPQTEEVANTPSGEPAKD
jgi:hypothetical protein